MRDSSALVARVALIGRHGRRRAVATLRGRFGDIVLLLLAVAIALVLRGVSRHRVLGGLEDVGWAAAAIGLYLPLVFGVGAFNGWRSLRGWQTSQTGITQGVMLGLIPGARTLTASTALCRVHCADGTQHESFVSPNDKGDFFCHYNSGFLTTGVHPPHGDHTARWFVKETERDGWIHVADRPFSYAPAGGVATMATFGVRSAALEANALREKRLDLRV